MNIRKPIRECVSRQRRECLRFIFQIIERCVCVGGWRGGPSRKELGLTRAKINIAHNITVPGSLLACGPWPYSHRDI